MPGNWAPFNLVDDCELINQINSSLKVEISVEKISPTLCSAVDVGSSLSESEKILSEYLKLDIQAKVNKIRIIIMVMIL